MNISIAKEGKEAASKKKSISSKKKKIFILDTNVILHDSDCIYSFEENDIVISMPVLEELDNFKKGTETINFHARNFVRIIDQLSAKSMFNGGVELGPGLGRLFQRHERELHPDIIGSFSNKETNDHRIIDVAYRQKIDPKNKGRQIIFVSKDVNARMKARFLGIDAEDYSTDSVLGEISTGVVTLEGVDALLIDKIYSGEEEILVSALPFETEPLINSFQILRNGKKSALTICCKSEKSEKLIVQRVERNVYYGISPKNAEQTFAASVLSNPSIKLIGITGRAGTGKTLLALATALEQKSEYRQILLVRPIIPVSNKDIGYLPGDIDSKIKPYMQPFYDNLGVIRSQFQERSEMYIRLQILLDEQKLAIEPLAYIRGRSLVKMFMIVDEAQNLTPHEVKTIITRAGEGTKIVFTGDINQIDHPYLGKNSNGLSVLVEKFRGQKLFSHIELCKGERSELADLAARIM